MEEERIPMSFDEMYDDMLHDEFSSRGKHQATAVTAEPELAESSSRGDLPPRQVDDHTDDPQPDHQGNESDQDQLHAPTLASMGTVTP